MIPNPTDSATDLLLEWLGSEPLPAGVRERIIRGLAVVLAEHRAERDRDGRELAKAWATALKTAALLDQVSTGGDLTTKAAA